MKTKDTAAQKQGAATPAIYSVAQYESGWYVEKSDPRYTLDECVFVQVAGPYKLEATARRKADQLNRDKGTRA